MGSREFIMKDAYSFHLEEESLDQTYQRMHQAYCNIFERIGLEFRPVIADSGSIGGAVSHEFHVLADSGEDNIAFSDGSDYAANVELAEAVCTDARAAATQQLEKVATPDATTIEQVATALQVDATSCVKTLIVEADQESEHTLVAIVIRGDHQLNDIKALKHPLVAAPFKLADEATVMKHIGCSFGSIGPVKLNMPILVDRSAAACSDFVCGANEDGYHLTGVNWERDVSDFEVCDLRNVVAGDASPDGKGSLQIRKGIEVGHIFQLGDKYSKAMNCGVLNESGKHQILKMGCYGIGVTRIVAAAIEQNHDKFGIKWPLAIAPFEVAIIPMNMHKSHRIMETALKLYADFIAVNVEVLFDDRKERPGVMFNDMELIGIPHSIVIGERNLDNNQVEYKNRMTGEKTLINIDEVIAFITNQ
jgi:prolyl-tRNA synthetase